MKVYLDYNIWQEMLNNEETQRFFILKKEQGWRYYLSVAHLDELCHEHQNETPQYTEFAEKLKLLMFEHSESGLFIPDDNGLEKLFGKACYFDSIVALSKNKFRQGNLVGKCVLVDDDMSFEGIKDTSFLKSLVTAETCISVEKKNVQAIQAKLCTRAVVFSNSNPNSLYDKTDGWHRRLIVLDTKPVPSDRKPDRYLSEKLIAELDGIFFWALEGLRRLIENDFIFTVSNKTREIMENLKQENCNVAEFMNDAQAVQLSPDSTTCSVDIYNAYVNWCQSNGLQELKQKSFYDWLYHNCESYNLSPTNKAHNGRNCVRGYVGISVSYRSKAA